MYCHSICLYTKIATRCEKTILIECKRKFLIGLLNIWYVIGLSAMNEITNYKTLTISRNKTVLRGIRYYMHS